MNQIVKPIIIYIVAAIVVSGLGFAVWKYTEGRHLEEVKAAETSAKLDQLKTEIAQLKKDAATIRLNVVQDSRAFPVKEARQYFSLEGFLFQRTKETKANPKTRSRQDIKLPVYDDNGVMRRPGTVVHYSNITGIPGITEVWAMWTKNGWVQTDAPENLGQQKQ